MRKFIAENKTALVCLLFTVFILTLFPIFEKLHYGNSGWRGAPPSYIDDNYYYVRMKEIIDGYPLLGNPYFFEHRKDIAPAFLLPDLISAMPLFTGLPLFAAVSFNFSFWALVLAALLFALFRRVGLSKRWSAVGALLCFIQVYLLVLRPVSMQLVFPVFILFLLAFLRWNDDRQKMMNTSLLSGGIALAFYDYAYLAQIIIVFMGLMFAYSFYIKEKGGLRHYFYVTSLAILIALPVLWLTAKQLSSPYYWDTMLRTGLVYTHLPTALVFVSGSWVISLCLLFLSFKNWFVDLKNDVIYNKFSIIFLTLGIAMVIVSGSNLITGKELETAQHIERFITLWLAIGTFVLSYYAWKVRGRFSALTVAKKLITTIFALVVLVGNIHYSKSLLELSHSQTRKHALLEAEEYMPAFMWLDANESESKVIWVSPNSYLASIIPIYTKHYLLYANGGILHLLSFDEVKERYLVAKYLELPSPKDLQVDARSYAGVGYFFHQVNTHNRGVRICQIMRLYKLGYECGITETNEDLNHLMYENMWNEYNTAIVPHIQDEVRKYKVSYIMKDKKEDKRFLPELITTTKPAYEDERFVIYKIDQ